MADRGRKPKPAHLKVVTGNPGKRPPKEDVPAPEGEVVRPDFLKHRELELWNEYAPRCIEMGVLTPADELSFANWCVLQAEFETQKARMPAAMIAQLRIYAETFCMTAPARAKNGTGREKPKAKSKAASYF